MNANKASSQNVTQPVIDSVVISLGSQHSRNAVVGIPVGAAALLLPPLLKRE